MIFVCFAFICFLCGLTHAQPSSCDTAVCQNGGSCFQIETASIGCLCTSRYSGALCQYDLCDVAYCNARPAPVLSLPANVSLASTADFTPTVRGTGAPTASGPCGIADILYRDTILDEPATCKQVIQRTFMAVDSCNKSATGIQLIQRTPSAPVANVTLIPASFSGPSAGFFGVPLSSSPFDHYETGHPAAPWEHYGEHYEHGHSSEHHETDHSSPVEHYYVGPDSPTPIHLPAALGSAFGMGSPSGSSSASAALSSVTQCPSFRTRYYRVLCSDPSLRYSIGLFATALSNVSLAPASSGRGPRRGPSVVTHNIPVSCGQTIGIHLLNQNDPPAPLWYEDSNSNGNFESSESSGHSLPPVERLSPGQLVLNALQVQLAARYADQCGTTGSSLFNPALDPDPACTYRLFSGSCCPSLQVPAAPVGVLSPPSSLPNLRSLFSHRT